MMPSSAAAGLAVSSTVTRVGTVQRSARAASAAGRPRSVRIAGLIPRDRSRSSTRASFTSPCASAIISATAWGSSARISLAMPRPMARATSRACAPSCRLRSIRRRSVAASRAARWFAVASRTRCSTRADGASRPVTIARSTATSIRVAPGSTTQATVSSSSAATKLRMPHGSRMNRNSASRQATGSPSVASPGPRWPGRRDGGWEGVGMRRPSRRRALARSSEPNARQIRSPATSTGMPTTVTARPTPREITTVTTTNPTSDNGRFSSRWSSPRQVTASATSQARSRTLGVGCEMVT